jgi:hypothetical protein
MAKIYPMGLIIAALLILVIPGILYNNFTSSGFNPSFALGNPITSVTTTCNAYPDVTCQNIYASGCQIKPAQCTLSGTSITILNHNSPFTPLLSWNVFGGFSQ